MRITDDDPERPWDELGVRRLADAVHRIPLPMPGDGLRAVNCFALTRDDGALTLIDPGVHLEAAQVALVDGLAALGATDADVRDVLVTHSHYDHYAQAVMLRRRRGMPVWLGRGEQPTLEAVRKRRRPHADQDRLLRRFGAPDLATWFLEQVPDEELMSLVREGPDRWIDDQQGMALDGVALEAFHTPGHTAGHVVFRDDRQGVLYAGDHVLPAITPSIGFETVVPPSPLGSYLGSLHRVRRQPDARLLPAHGHPGPSVHARIDELVAHHDDRLAASVAAVADGVASAAEVAVRLPWTRRQRPFADLDPFNRGLAVLETGFHLDLLVDRGTLSAAEEAGVTGYAPA